MRCRSTGRRRSSERSVPTRLLAVSVGLTFLVTTSDLFSRTKLRMDAIKLNDKEEDVEMLAAETLLCLSAQNYNSQPLPQAPTTPKNSPQKILPSFSTMRTADSLSDYLSSPRTLKNYSSPRTPLCISRVSPPSGARLLPFSATRTADSLSDCLSSRTLKNNSSPRTSISRISPPPEARLLLHQFSTSRTADAMNDYVPSSPTLSTKPPEASHPSLLSMSRTLTVMVNPLMPPPTISVSSRTASIPSLDRKTPECPNSGHETNCKTVPRNFASARSPTCFNPAEQVSTGHSSRIKKKYVYPKIGSLPIAVLIPKTPSDSDPILEKIHFFDWTFFGSKAMKHELIGVPELNKLYRQVKLIGKGGFAKVYLVINERTKETYACKVISRTVKKKQTHHILKIQQEIDIHKKLNHENVVKMHEAFSTLSDVYMLLEACPQKTLMHVLHCRKSLTEPETRYYMKQIVAGVEYIHSQNIIHRDLKPGNMFLSTEMIVKIGDFGLATIADKNRRMTVCGTPNYIAPEMLKQHESGFPTDIWALGCTCYALLMGQPPFESPMLDETYDLICKHKYLTIGQSLVSSCSEDLINMMLRPSPEDRATLTDVKEHSFFRYYTPMYLPRASCHQIPREILEPSIARNQEPEPQAHYPAVHPNESVRHNVAHHQQSPQIQQQEQPRHENSVNRCFWSNSFVFCSWRHKLNELLPSLGFRKTLFLKTDGLRKKKTNPMLMYRALNTCVKEMKPTSDNPQTVDHITPLFVTRWIDFSLKYGLAFKLSDQSIGLVFNDNTKISYTHDRQKVEYATANDQIERYRRENDMPEQLKEKLKLLHRFTDYLNNRLIDGAELTAYRSPSKQKNACVPRMKRWMHIQDKGTVMELTKPLLQMNFTKDHTKIVLSYESKTTDYLVTYIDTSRQMTSYWLNDLRKNGCTADLYCRLLYLHETLLKFNEMDANTISS